MHLRRYILVFITAALLLPACAPQIVTVTVTSPPETVVITATPSPAPTPTPPPPELKTLDICLIGEPDTLYLYGDSRLTATRHVMEALYDGPIDHHDYAYQPAILQKLPRIADGDAVTRTTYVREGDRVANVDGEVVELAEGVRIRPSGCYTEGCEIVFESGLVRMERMEATFALRDDLTWADGEPITATDSIFAFEVASDQATPAYRDLIERTAYYRALGERRVKWIGVPGFVDQTYFLNFFPPLPRHQLEGRSPATLLGAEETRRRPLGWGPFVVDEWIRGDHITLSPNPNYFRADEGLPYLDQVVFKFATGASDLVARLLAGECDVGTHSADFETLMPLLMHAQDRGLLTVASAPGNRWAHIDFGIVPAPDYGRPDFFGDVRVRQAIAQCIDRQAIVDEITHGLGVISDSYLPPGHPLYPRGDLRYWDHNPAAGRALLDEVGWLDEDGDGVREARRIEGVRIDTPFEVTLLTPSDDAASREMARIVGAQLADCGLRVNVEARPSWEIFAEGPEGPLFGRRFDLVVTTSWLAEMPACRHYLSSEIPDEERWDGDNVTGYANPEFDAACRAALRALPGTLAYERHHRRAQIIFSEDLPAVPLFTWPRVAIADPAVLNFEMDPTAQSELWRIEMLDLRD